MMGKVKQKELEPCRTCGWLSVDGEICTLGRDPWDGKCKHYRHVNKVVVKSDGA